MEVRKKTNKYTRTHVHMFYLFIRFETIHAVVPNMFIDLQHSYFTRKSLVKLDFCHHTFNHTHIHFSNVMVAMAAKAKNTVEFCLF